MQFPVLYCRNKWITNANPFGGWYTSFYLHPEFGKALIPDTLITFILSKLRPPTA